MLCQALDTTSLFAKLSTPFHLLCREFEPRSFYREAYSALVCGSNLSKSELRDSLQATSLLHLAIVSGSHLLLLENIADRILKKQRRRHLYISSILFIYSLLTGWQPPAVRAVVGRWLSLFNSQFYLNWTSLQTTWFAGWLTWIFFPQWTTSYSLLLSWGASLGLAIAGQFDSNGFFKEWKVHLIVYLTILPILMPLSPPHPFSILCNWLAGPLLGVLLFPLSLIAFVIPWITPICDLFWQLTSWIVMYLAQWTPPINTKIDTPIIFLWSYLLLLHTVMMVLEIHRKKRERNAF